MTDAARPSRVDRVLAWLPLAIVAVLLLVVVRFFAVPLTNTDVLFHLRFGHEFLTDWVPWDPGHVSTLGQTRWWPTQWASQVVMALAYAAGGLPAVVWLAGAVGVLLLLVVYAACRRGADPLPSAVATAFCLLSLVGFLAARPQLASYLLAVVVASAWWRTARDGRARWWLVAVTWVWVLLHGMWPLAPMIGILSVVGMALDRRRHDAGVPPVSLRRLALIPLLSLVAAALTPVGPGVYLAVVNVGSQGQFHAEWGPTNLRTPSAAGAAALFVVVVVGWALRPAGATRWTEVLLVLFAGVWVVYAQRTVPIGGVLLAPVAASTMQEWLSRHSAAADGRVDPPHEKRWLAVAAVVALVVLAVLVPSTSDRVGGIPRRVDRTLGSLPAHTVVLTDDAVGSWLMWRHPQLDPTLDAYSDTFTDAYLVRAFAALRLGPGWQDEVRRTGARYAVVREGEPLITGLTEVEHWRTLEVANGLVVLQAPGGRSS